MIYTLDIPWKCASYVLGLFQIGRNAFTPIKRSGEVQIISLLILTLLTPNGTSVWHMKGDVLQTFFGWVRDALSLVSFTVYCVL